MILALIVLTAAAIAVLPALRLLDNWLSRGLDRAWDADQVDPSVPLFEQTVKACGYRPGVGS